MTDPQASLTPNVHGQWRVINGTLVDESTLPVADVITQALAPAPADPSSQTLRRKAPAKPE